MVANIHYKRSKALNNNTKYHGIYEGIIKDNSDFQRMGRLAIWVPELGSPEEDTEGWVVATYLSPFAGATDVDENRDDDTYEGTQRSYGFWAIPPDTGNRVAVQFINGESSRAIWVGCFYQQYRNGMVPNIPAQNNHQYGEKVPSAEVNVNNGNPESPESTRPFHRAHYEAIRNQGLYDDPIRGYSQFGATSDPLSRVYGMLTPKGHYWSMEDTDGDEKIRIRTIGGAQILLDDANSIVYVTNQKGNGWVEIDGDGKIMVYSEEGLSIRSNKDISMLADRDLIFEAERNTVFKSKNNIFLETENLHEKILENHNVNVGVKRSEIIEDYSGVVRVNHVLKVDNDYTLGIDGQYNTTVEGDHNTFTRSDLNCKSKGQSRVTSEGDYSLSTKSRANLISDNVMTVAGKKIVENTGGTSPPARNATPASPEVNEIVERPTYEYEDAYQEPKDNGTRKRRVRSIVSTYPSHEPARQHAKPSNDRQENNEGVQPSTTDETPETSPESPTGTGVTSDTGDLLEDVKNDLRRHEGVVPYVYPDPVKGASHPTAGIGHLLTSSERSEYSIGDPVSNAQVNEWLDNDVQIALNGAKKIYGDVWDSLSDTRKKVLINMCFNLGTGGLSDFRRMNAAIKESEFQVAANEMRSSLWYSQVGTRAKELETLMRRG